MRSEGSRFTLGVGRGMAVFAQCCVCGRNRPQPSATVCVRAVRLSSCVNASGVVQKVCQADSWRSRYIGVCRGGVCVGALCRRSYHGVCRGGVCVSDLWRRSFHGVCRGGVCASDLWRSRYHGVCRGGVCVKACQVRASHKSLKWECPARVSNRSVLQKCQVRLSHKSVK